MKHTDIQKGTKPRICLSCDKMFNDGKNDHRCPRCGGASRAEPSIHPVFAINPISDVHIGMLKNSIITQSFWALLNEETLEIGDPEDELEFDEDSGDDPLNIE